MGDPALKNADTLRHYGISIPSPDASGFTFVGYGGTHGAKAAVAPAVVVRPNITPAGPI